jgi:CheY-like chemotaxis protein
MSSKNDKLRVLIVDNDEDVRILSTKWLSDSYDVDTSISGYDCINRIEIQGEHYDIIFLDIMMEGPSQDELVKRIIAKLPNVKIIYLTAVKMFQPTPDQERKGYLPVLHESVKGYLEKPVTKQQLLDKIKEVLELDKLLK